MRTLKEHDEIGEHLVFIYEKLKELYREALDEGWSELFSKSFYSIEDRIQKLKDVDEP